MVEWERVGAHWGMPRALLMVHAWLMSESAPRSTDDVMKALGLSRGRAHGVLQELVDWKLVHPLKRLGTRQVRYLAESDPWTMLLAIVQQRKARELDPLVELGAWVEGHRSDLAAADRTQLGVNLSLIALKAQQVSTALDWVQQEDETRWWSWLLSPLRTK